MTMKIRKCLDSIHMRRSITVSGVIFTPPGSIPVPQSHWSILWWRHQVSQPFDTFQTQTICGREYWWHMCNPCGRDTHTLRVWWYTSLQDHRRVCSRPDCTGTRLSHNTAFPDTGSLYCGGCTGFLLPEETLNRSRQRKKLTDKTQRNVSLNQTIK